MHRRYNNLKSFGPTTGADACSKSITLEKRIFRSSQTCIPIIVPWWLAAQGAHLTQSASLEQQSTKDSGCPQEILIPRAA